MRLKQEYDKATNLLEKVVKIKKKIHGGDIHEDIGYLYSDLALAYRGLENYQKAIECLKECIKINRGLNKENTLEQVSIH